MRLAADPLTPLAPPLSKSSRQLGQMPQVVISGTLARRQLSRANSFPHQEHMRCTTVALGFVLISFPPPHFVWTASRIAQPGRPGRRHPALAPNDDATGRGRIEA